jgi:hypothetical protein
MTILAAGAYTGVERDVVSDNDWCPLTIGGYRDGNQAMADILTTIERA